MKSATWHFKRRERSDEVADPIQAEFFDEASDPDERRRGPAASLVREAIQNSLDAQAGAEPVHVRFYVSDLEALGDDCARKWFVDLWAHLRARRAGLRSVQAQPRACRFIVIEDFGTSGLEGNARRGTTPEEDERDDFFAFFRANGLSGKAGQEGGRWGVGKSVFNRASRINTFLALSVRSSDQSTHLIGRCFLLTHKINGNEYQPYGRFGLAEKDDFVLPVDDGSMLNAFRRDFCVSRELDTPGLSVVVPYADDEITAEAIRSAVVREYFWPILAGRLTVSISGSSAGAVRLNPDTLLACAEEEDQAGLGIELQSLMQFAIEAQTFPDSGIITLGRTGESPRWIDSLFPEGRLEELAKGYQRSEILAFRVPLRVRERHRAAQDSNFLVYIRLDRDGNGYPPVFVRSGLIIPKARERRVKNHSVHALVVIEDRGLSSMLGDAETPAHTHWSPDSRNFRDKYEDGADVIRFVKSAPVEIVEILSRAREEKDWLALAQFFPEPDDDGHDAPEGRGKRKGKGTRIVEDRAPPRPKPFRIVESPGGFRITRDNSADTAQPARLIIRVAYDTSRGSALGMYHPADFLLSELGPHAEGAAIEECEGNRLVIVPHADDFAVEVKGFDENRDLYVKVQAEDTVVEEGGEA